MKKTLWFILPIIAVGLAWEVVSRSGIVNPSLFPPVSKVFLALWEMVNSGIIITDVGNSLWRLLLGLFFGSVIGIVLGLITGRVKKVSSLLVPIIQALRPLPPVAIIPLVIVWLGIDNTAKIFSIAFAVFFPVWINTYIGAQQIPQTFLWSAKLLTTSTLKVFYRVIFPATLPFAIAGIRSAIAVSYIMVFVSELAGASSGLGYRIAIAQSSYRIDEMIAALIVLGILGALTDYLFVLSTKKMFPYLALRSQ
ncbi:MAG: ABC transporter permease [Patescibacteria group bacterium]|jgi:ABC-type nitrate/sulfonate/bicarbonate transport system permease component